jgi:hypothetical protein
MYQLFVIYYYSDVCFVNMFKPLRIIIVKNEVQYLNEKLGTHQIFKYRLRQAKFLQQIQPLYKGKLLIKATLSGSLKWPYIQV